MPPSPNASILYVALADARGHLMRAHILRELLALHGVEVRIATTSRAGQSFLASFGTPSALISEHFRIEFDGRHNMLRRATDARVLRYLLSPRRGARDLRWLRQQAARTDLVVADSFHPALMLAPRRMKVAWVYGENLWRATLNDFDDRAPRFGTLYRTVLARLERRAFARVVHTLGTTGRDPETFTYRLPPILPMARRSPAEVRTRLGLHAEERLAVLYLNPHFRDPRIAELLETHLRRRGYRLHAVGEGYADRRGWVATDNHLIDTMAAADLVVSGAGMGVLGISRTLHVPLISLVTGQPEQQANALETDAERFRAIRLEGRCDIGDELETAVSALESLARCSDRPDPRMATARLQQAWTEVFLHLIRRARGEHAAHSEGYSHVREGRVVQQGPGHRNQQPARGRRRRRQGGKESAAPARASNAADDVARSAG